MEKDNKFDNFESLHNSYCELEKKFTQKCQQAAELERRLEQYNNESGTNVQTSPQTTAEQFYEQHPLARNFKERIDEAMSNPEVQATSDAIKACYIDCLESDYRTPQQMAEDEQFLQQYIVNDRKVRDMILQQMLAQTADTRYPVTISGNGGNMSLAQPTRPKTLEEASVLAKNYFK